METVEEQPVKLEVIKDEKTGAVRAVRSRVGDHTVSVIPDPSDSGGKSLEIAIFPNNEKGEMDPDANNGEPLYFDFVPGTIDDIEEVADTIANRLRAVGVDKLNELQRQEHVGESSDSK